MNKEKLEAELYERVNEFFEEKPQRPIAKFLLDTIYEYLGRETKQLLDELKVTDELLDKRNALLDQLPPCPSHGLQCLPWLREWFKACQYIIQTEHDWKKCGCLNCIDARTTLLTEIDK